MHRNGALIYERMESFRLALNKEITYFIQSVKYNLRNVQAVM